MNDAIKDSPSQAQLEHWLSGHDFSEQIAQGLTAYLPLTDAGASIASRLYLIHQAQHTLDLQYYIWKDDKIGHMLLHALLNAADRGVKVRLMIDDQNGVALDDTLSKLEQHPNIQIRIFNPYKFRHFRVLDYAFRLKQINHRMHNKLIIADGAIAVTGGRNISNEYFDASDDYQFSDMDILFFGQATQAANTLFQSFWNHELNYTSEAIIGKNKDSAALDQLRTHYQSEHKIKNHFKQLIEAEQLQIAAALKSKPIQWAPAHFIADQPSKITNQSEADMLIYHQMHKTLGNAEKQMDIVSAYFVPTELGVNYLTQLKNNGAQIRVLTNSYLANDVPVVHAFYQKYRVQLLKNGIQLYEFKPYIERPRRTWYEVMTGNIIPAKSKNASRLHAKFFDVDGKVFIGSFNFDPRSAKLNSEVGLVVESQNLEDEIHTSLNRYLPQIAYELKLNPNDEIIWIEHHTDGQKTIHKTEPQTSKFQRFMFKAIAYTPFEWLM